MKPPPLAACEGVWVARSAPGVPVVESPAGCAVAAGCAFAAGCAVAGVRGVRGWKPRALRCDGTSHFRILWWLVYHSA